MGATFEHNATYKIVDHCYGLALDVKNGETSNGAHVIVWPWHGSDNQLWKADKEGNGYRLTANHCWTLMALDEQGDGTISVWSPDVTTNNWFDYVQIREFNGGCHQQWNIVPASCKNDLFFIQNVSSGKCLRRSGTGHGDRVISVDKCECDQKQFWKITKV